MTRPLALRKVTPPAPEPVAFEAVVYEVERLAGAAHVLNLSLEQTEETDGQRTAALLAEALERQAALLRLFMGRPDDPAEAA